MVKTDFVLKLILRDIKDNMDVQVDTLKAQNDELRRSLNNMLQEQDDLWNSYVNMNNTTARLRLSDDSCRIAIKEFDKIAAEG